METLEYTRDTAPLPLTCAICGVSITTGEMRGSLLLGDESPITFDMCDLCAACAEPILPIILGDAPEGAKRAARLDILLSFLAQQLSTDPDPTLARPAWQLLDRWGWTDADHVRAGSHPALDMLELTPVITHHLDPRTVRRECDLCLTAVPAARAYEIADRDVARTVCEDCVGLLEHMAADGTIRTGTLPQADEVIRWAERHHPDKAEWVLTGRLRHDIPLAGKVNAVTILGPAFTGRPTPRSDGAWELNGFEIIDHLGNRSPLFTRIDVIPE